jgi:hypothetical protein
MEGAMSGRFDWAKVINLLTEVKYFLCISLFITWATLEVEIFSLPARSNDSEGRGGEQRKSEDLISRGSRPW